MIAFLTSSPGGCREEDGVENHAPFTNANGFLDRLTGVWKDQARCLLICAEPDNAGQNDKMGRLLLVPIPIFDHTVAGISHEKQSSGQFPGALPKMDQLYRKMVTDPSCRENLEKAARCVMEHDFSTGSVLWHCTEGKDRCGLLSAVLLLALGAERSTIMEDYLLTNRVNAAKSERYYRMMLEAGQTEAAAETIRDVFLAKEEYLNAAFSAIDGQYGNTDAFLRDGLRIPQELMERFQHSVL